MGAHVSKSRRSVVLEAQHRARCRCWRGALRRPREHGRDRGVPRVIAWRMRRDPNRAPGACWHLLPNVEVPCAVAGEIPPPREVAAVIALDLRRSESAGGGLGAPTIRLAAQRCGGGIRAASRGGVVTYTTWQAGAIDPLVDVAVAACVPCAPQRPVWDRRCSRVAGTKFGCGLTDKVSKEPAAGIAVVLQREGR